MFQLMPNLSAHLLSTISFAAEQTVLVSQYVNYPFSAPSTRLLWTFLLRAK